MNDAAAQGLELVKGELDVGHCAVVRERKWRSPSDAHTIAVIATRFIDLAQRVV